MKWQNIIAALMLSTGLIAYPQTSQELSTAPPPSSRFPAKWYPAPNNYASAESPVKGEPYAATMVTTNILVNAKPHADGTYVARNHWYRDSAGRTRTEEGGYIFNGVDGRKHTDNSYVTVSATDSVTHCSFRWQEPWTHSSPPVATVQCLPLTYTYLSTNHLASIENQEARDDLRGISEPLGHKILEGLDVVGMRRTSKIDPQSAKDDPNSLKPVSMEFWVSPKLHELMFLGAVPAQPGIVQFELQDVHLGEQNPDLFYPPANYRILGPGETLP